MNIEMFANQIPLIVSAGLTATALMTIFVFAMSQAVLGEGKVLQVVGSSITGSLNSAAPIAGIVHIITGLFFAFAYFTVFHALQATYGAALVGAGFIFGFLHGVVVALIVVISIGENHPLRRFRPEGQGLGAIYFGAHIIYGTTLGLMFWLAAQTSFLPHW